MKKDVRVYLAQMLERIEKIEGFTEPGKQVFLEQDLVQDAVLHNLAIIGEAAKRVDPEARALYPSIPWRGMSALRDVLIHDYEETNLEEVWAVVENDLPPLKRALIEALPPLDQLEKELSRD